MRARIAVENREYEKWSSREIALGSTITRLGYAETEDKKR